MDVTGMLHAPSERMPSARHYSQLIVWKLAEQIRIEIFALTAKPHFAADLRAKSQAEDAANSMGRNIAEGFGCETHAEFARYLEIARRSLNELHDILHGAQLKKYVTTAELTTIRQLSRRLYPAFSRFIAYLKRTPNFRPRRGTPDAENRPGENRTRSLRPASPARIDQRKLIVPTSVSDLALTIIADGNHTRQKARTDKRR